MTNSVLKHNLTENSIFYSLYENLPKAIFIMDLDGNFVHANRAAEILTGYRFDDVCSGLSIYSLSDRQNSETTLFHVEKALQGKPQEFEHELIHKDGYRVHVDVTIISITLNEKIIGFFVVAKDITRRNREIEQLRSTKQHLESFIKNSGDAVCIFDLEGRILQVNDAFERIYGWSEQEVKGGEFPLLPENINSELQQIYKKMKLGIQIPGFEMTRQRKDGTWIDVSITFSPIRDARGNVISFSAISRDITEQNYAKHKLSQSEKNLVLAQRIAQMGSWEWNLINNSKYWSQETYRIFGIENDSTITDELYYSFIHEQDLELVKTSFLNLEKGIPYDIEFRIVRPDGTVRTLHKLAEIEYDVTGRIIRMFGTIHDITERKHTQELLMKSEKLAVLGQLAAGIGHEIRNPLASIKGFVQLLQTKLDEYPKYFEIILSELNRINSIVSEFMVLAKPQVINYQLRNVVAILQEVLPLLETHAILTNVQIFTVYGSDIPLINCEENQIKQVFINILKNSLDAMPSGGRIFVHVKRQEQENILIRFIDEGSGIPQEHIPKLGEPFYTTKEKGTGLGLMVSHKIIENHGGKIQISSQVGKGTTIDLILPCN